MERDEREKEAIRQRAMRAASDMEGALGGDLYDQKQPAPVTTATQTAGSKKLKF